MRAIWYLDGPERSSGCYITDLMPLEFTIYWVTQYGYSPAITHVSDVSVQDAQRLSAKGIRTLYKRELGRV